MDIEEARAEEEQEDQVEAEPLKMARDPTLPSAADVELHNRTHIPCRDWCKWCNSGRGRGIPHRPGGESGVPIVGIDYFLITSEGVKRRKEFEFKETSSGETAVLAARASGEITKCIVIRCFSSKSLFAHCVPVKGEPKKTIQRHWCRAQYFGCDTWSSSSEAITSRPCRA